MANIDSLDIKISASAQNANKSIGTLITNLSTLSNSLGKLNGDKFKNFSSALDTLSNGMQKFQNIKTTDFSKLVKGIEKFQNLDDVKLTSVGNALKPLADGVNTLNSASFDNKNIQNLINSLTRLSNANVGGLVDVNFKKIGTSITQLAKKLSKAPEIGQSVIQMTNALANLSQSGNNLNTVSTQLPLLSTNLNNLMNTLSGAPAISGETIIFTQAIGLLGSAGDKVGVVAAQLPQLSRALMQFFQVMSKAPTVSTHTIQMTNALTNLASQGSKASSASKSMGNSIGGMVNPMKKAKKSVNSLAASIGKFYATFFLVIRGIKKLWSSINESMNYVESLNFFNKAFGQVASNADLSSYSQLGYDSASEYYNSFAERAEQLTSKLSGFTVTENGTIENTRQKSLGINPTQVMKYQAMYGQMASSMGVASETAMKMSQALTEIGADLSTVRNMDFDKVWTDMASGLAGMSRTLDKYGVNIRNVNLQQKLNELGIEANISALNQNDKALLRTIILLENTKYAWGDNAQTLNRGANQLRMLKSNFANLSRTIGNIFLPTVATVLPYINGLVIALQRLAERIAKIVGLKNPDFDWGGIGGADDDILSQLYDDADTLSDNLDDATKNAKKLKYELMGFDEINKLSDDSDSSSTGSGLDATGTGILEAALDKALSDYQTAWDKAFDEMENKANSVADKIVKAFKSKDFEGIGRYISTSLRDALDGIHWENVYEGAGNFAEGLAEFLNGLFRPDTFYSIGKTISNSLNTILYSLFEFSETFDWENFGTSAANGVNGFFDNFDFKLFAKTVNSWVKGLAKAFVSFVKDLDKKDIFKALWDFLTNLDIETVAIGISAFTITYKAKVLKKAVVGKLLPKITKWFSENSASLLEIGIAITILTIAFEFAKSRLETIYNEYDLDEIKEASEAMFSDWFGNNPLSLTLSDVFVSISTFIVDPKEVEDAFKLMWKDIKNGDFKFNLLNMVELDTESFDTWKDAFKLMWKDIKNGDFKLDLSLLEEIGEDSLKGILKGVKGSFSKLVDPVIAGVDTNKIVEKFSEISEAVKESIDKIDMSINDYYTSSQAVIDKYDYIKDVADKYIELSSNYTTLTDEQKSLLVSYAEILKDNVQGVEEYIDPVTNAYTGTRDELDNLIETTKNYYLVLGAKEKLAEYGKHLADIQTEISKTTEKLNEALTSHDTNAWGEQMESYIEWAEDARNKTALWTEGNKKYEVSYKSVIDALEKAGYRYDSLSKDEKKAFDQLLKYDEVFAFYMEKIGKETPNNLFAYQEESRKLADEMDYLNEVIASGGESVTSSTKTAIVQVGKTKTAVSDTTSSINKDVKTMGKNYASVTGEMPTQMTKAFDKTKNDNMGKASSTGSILGNYLSNGFNNLNTYLNSTTTNALDNAKNSNKSNATNAGSKLSEYLSNGFNEIKAKMSNNTTSAFNLLQNNNTKLSNSAGLNLASKLSTGFSQISSFLSGKTTNALNNANSQNTILSKNIGNNLQSLLSGGFGNLNFTNGTYNALVGTYNDNYNEFNNFGKSLGQTFGDGVESGFDDKKGGILGKISDLFGNLKINTTLGAGAGIALGFQVQTYGTYATGGFPEDGWFRASKGEYFGHFDDGTSYIANNNQIENGIATGVEEAAYRGMMRALSESQGNQNVTIQVEGDPNGMFKVMRKQANDFTKRTGKAAFPV